MPILPWNNKYLGSTQYIDRVTKKDLDSSAMIGQDCYRRAYIIFRFKYEKKKYVGVFFQRYTLEKNTWASAINTYYITGESGHFMSGGKLKHKLIKKNMQNLVNNKRYIIKYKECFSDELIEKHNVYLE